MTTIGLAHAPLHLDVRSIDKSAPLRWLEQGYKDLLASRGESLRCGLLIFAMSWLVTGGMWALGLEAWTPALAGGFLIVGPLLAVGLYDTSCALEKGAAPARRSLLAVHAASGQQILYLGFLLAFIYLVWLRIAMLLYALFSYGEYAPLADFISHSLTTANGMWLIAVGSAIGGVLAFIAFAVSAISVPLLVAQPVDGITAVLTSLKAVERNLVPMLIWAWLIALLTAFGIVTGFAGLIVIFPLIGHASWHAYRELVSSPAP